MLWAVRVRAEDKTLDQMYPVETEADARDSAGRLNTWVREQTIKHPETAPALRAEVIEWPNTPEEHAESLQAVNRLMEANTEE